jgi:hypothetical protein
MMRKIKILLLISILLSVISMVESIPLVECYYSESFGGILFAPFGKLVFNSLSIDIVTDTNRKMMMSFTSEFLARGPQPGISISIYNDGSTPTSILNAYVVIDVIMYYVDGATDVEIGTYFRTLSASPQNYSSEILYQVDLKGEVDNILGYFSTKVSNPKAEDIGFAGRFIIQNEFANSTGIVSDKGFLRLPLTFDGNMSLVSLDVTVPEEYDLVTYKWGSEDMIKIFPNRVRSSFSVKEDQRITSELYMEWKLPEVPPPPPIFQQHPWIIPLAFCLLGLFLGHIWGNQLYPRYFRPHAHLRVLYGDSHVTIDNAMGKAPVAWAEIIVRTKNVNSIIRGFTTTGSLDIRRPEPYSGGNYFWVIIHNITPSDWGSIGINMEGPPSIEVEVKSSCQHEPGGRQTVGPAPIHGVWGEEESYEKWLQKHQGKAS